MIKKGFLVSLLLIFFTAKGQIVNFKEKFLLTPDVSETSGLIFFNNHIVTHNDSGDEARLYEIDTINGDIKRIVNISNAMHVDWEDITQNDTHIFIADIGNNSGNRQDLKIYKVAKSDYLNSDSVTAEIITFSYEDQTDFTANFNNHNFDAEAITIYQNQLLIFTKNWVDLKTNVYAVPLNTGNHTATKVSSYQVNGLITGVSYNPGDDSFMFCGYDSNLVPFLLYVSQNRQPGLDIFFSGAQKIDLTNILEQGSQIEGITFFDGAKYYLSREFFSRTINGIPFMFPQKIYKFESQFFSLLSTHEVYLNSQIVVYPNPIKNSLFLKNSSNLTILKFNLFDSVGKMMQTSKEISGINWNILSSGNYSLRIIFSNNKSIVKRLIKE